MHRRELLAGVASAGAVAGGGWIALRGLPDPASSDPDDVESTDADPIEIETLDAPGSEAGTALVPEPGRVTFLDFFGTWCQPCIEQMPTLATVAAQVGDDVQFLSVTQEPVGRSISREELAAWWADHDGAWTVGIDPAAKLSVRYDVTGYPTAVAIDAENERQWTHRGTGSADEFLEGIEIARESAPVDGGD